LVLVTAIAKILKGNSKFYTAMRTFSSGPDFTMGLGKLQLYANLKSQGFIHCRNTKGKPQIAGSHLLRTSIPFLLCIVLQSLVWFLLPFCFSSANQNFGLDAKLGCRT